MNIQIEAVSVVAKVKDHRGYKDMIFRLCITLNCKDQDTNSSIGHQLDHILDTEFEYNEQNPFISFDQISKEEVDAFVSNIINEYRVNGQKTLLEWAQDRFNDIYSEPVFKPFSFEELPEPVGMGTTTSF